MQSFMLDFLLPEIAWEMERREVFYLDEYEIEEIITPVLTGTGDKDICGKHGRMLFEKYREGDSARAHTKKTAKQLMELGNEDPEEATELAIDTCLLSLGILQANNGKYGFMHHHIRDYFAAVRNVNSLRMAVYLGEHGGPAMDCLKDWQGRPIFPEVRRFVGEMLGEHHNAPVCVDGTWRYNVPKEPCDRNLIERVLDLYRGRFGGEDGYALYSLTSILKDVRGDLSGMDLSRLDLTHISFNGVQFGKTALGANLCGAMISAGNVFPIGHTLSVTSVAFCQNASKIVTTSEDGTTKIWDVATEECLRTIVGHAVYSPDGRKFLARSDDNTGKIWDAETGVCLRILNGPWHKLYTAAWNSDGSKIVTTFHGGAVRIWSVSTGECLQTLEGHRKSLDLETKARIAKRWKASKLWDVLPEYARRVPDFQQLEVSSAVFSPEGNRIVTASDDGTAKIWDAVTGECLRTLVVNTDQVHAQVNSAVYSPNGNEIVTASGDIVKKWNAATGECLRLMEDPAGVVSAAYSPDGTKIVTTTDDGTAKFWDAATGSLLRTMEGLAGVDSIAYSPDGKKIVTLFRDRSVVEIWDAQSFFPLGILIVVSWQGVRSVAWESNGSKIMVACLDKIVRIWDIATRKHLISLVGHVEEVMSADYSPDGKTIITASRDGTAKIWDAASGACLRTLEGHTDCVHSVIVISDGSIIETHSYDGSVRTWDTASGKCLQTQEDLFDDIIAASPNGSIIATHSNDHSDNIEIWDAASGECLQILEGHTDWVRSAAYSPIGDEIATASDNGIVKIWNALSGHCLQTIMGHAGIESSIAYSPSGNEIVTAQGRTVKVWDVSTGECLQTLEDNTIVDSVSYNPDWSKIATASLIGTVKIWDAETGKCLDTLPNVPGLIVHGVDFRNLHPDSRFSEEEKELLRRYGAIVDDTDT